MINALNSGARVFMADLEDALSPTWANVVGGQAALMDAVRGTLDVRVARGQGVSGRRARRPSSSSGRVAGTSSSRTCSSTTCRSAPRCSMPGCTSSTTPPSGSPAAPGRTCTCPSSSRTTRRGCGTRSSSTPRRRSASRAGRSGRPCSSRRSRAAFEMDEILYELREHAAGLNAGRWDYLFSVIKQFHDRADFASPDRAQLTMTLPFMRAYTDLLVATCHRRGAHAIGGMAAFIPNRRDPEVTTRGAGQGPRRQGARVRRRLRRHVGRPSRPRAGRHGDLRRRPRRPAEPEGASAGRCPAVGGGAARLLPSPTAPSPRPASGPTSGWPWPTSTPGCRAPVPRPSTT